MVKKSIAVIAAMIGSLIVAIGLDSGTASAHKVLVSGVADCVENGEWTITWTLVADRTDGTDSWNVLSPNGYTPDGPQDPSLPFTRTETVPASIDRVTEGAEVEWTLNGRRVFYARGWATVRQPTDPCTPGTAPPVTTVPPPVTDPPPTDPPTTDPPTTDPPTTDPPTTDPPTTAPPATDPPTTDPPSTDPPATTEPPDGTPPEPVPPVTDPPDGGSSTPPPGQTDPPDDSSTGGSLPETGSDATRQALTAALLLLVLGGAAFVIAQPLRRDESAD
ncbi:MAG: hypothetical protein AAGD33_04100 [Actinomycetota bacterium]